MSEPDVDEIVNHLSTKFNKIFCERDFVCSVNEDLHSLLANKNKCCVLLFPELGPVYLKAIRYHAKILDLAVFTLASSKHKCVAVCRKHLLTKRQEVKDEAMADSSQAIRRKRPERQLYVPPAQRKSMLKEAADNDKKVKLLPLHIQLQLQSPHIPTFLTYRENSKTIPRIPNGCFHFLHNFKNATLLPFYSNSPPHYETLFIYNKLLCLNWLPELSVSNVQSTSSTFQPLNLETPLTEQVHSPLSVLYNDWEPYTKPDVDQMTFSTKTTSEFEVLDLSDFNLGHYFILYSGTQGTLFACSENHDVRDCCIEKQSMLAKQEEEKKITKAITEIYNGGNKKQTDKKSEHEEEKEIMRKTKENINRKTRPIMKYMDDSNDTLKIGKEDNLNNWEDLFDDEGQLQEELLSEITHKVGSEVTIVKATEDYSAYTSKPIEELEHIVELYNFPSTLETKDIIQAFSSINSDAMYIKWVDDTHALLVLGSLAQAQRAVEMDNPIIKARPMTAASGASLAVAYKSDLKPAMKRPQTNLQTARRLITSHLGTRTKISKEQSAKESADLKLARELKKQARQNERDAWEGNLKSTKRD